MGDWVKPGSVAVGVDIGGTKVAAGLVDTRGRVLAKISEPLQASEARPDITIAQVVRLIRHVTCGGCSRDDLAIGVGVPAVIDRKQGVVVWAPNIPGWRTLQLREEFSRQLHTSRITLDFDGNTAVLAEGWVGAGQGRKNVVFLIIGTGIGAGMILDGQLYRGSVGIPGGVGWYALDPALIADAVASRAPSFEELCAGPGLLRMANARSPGAETDTAGDFPDTQALFAAYDRGDKKAVQVLKRAITYVGMGVANLVSTLNPEVLIIGGGIGMQYCSRPSLFDEIRHLVSGLAQPAAARAVDIRAALLGADAGMVGAAKLALDEFNSGE